MNPDFWHKRWADNQIGFHQAAPTPMLVKHWPSLGIAADAKVFVPLCGKSLDMVWLAAQGHRVLGVELSQLAVEQFFEDHGLTPDIEKSDDAMSYRAGGIELICGDAFMLDPALLADCTAVVDRAALIALPPTLRQRYATELYARLPSRCTGLLITLEYPQHEKDGPPFAVQADEVQALFEADWAITRLEHAQIPPDHPGRVDGVSQAATAAYMLRRG
jgi:thiopurine S-methyltransferase